MNNVKLVGVADIIPERAERAAREFNCTPYTDFRELLPQVDAVSIAVPTTIHYQVTREVLSRGIHTLLEKPITTTLEEADELIELTKKNHVILQIGHIERFNAAVLKLRSLVTEPKFIEIHRLAPFTTRGSDVSVVLDLMIHDLDIISTLVPGKITSIDAVGVPVLTKNEDIANARIRFDSGCVANVTASRIALDRMRKIRIFQPATYISLDYLSQEISLYRHDRNIPFNPDNPMEGIQHQLLTFEDAEEPLHTELRSFIEAVHTGSEPIVTGEDGRNALKVVLDITAQIRNGSTQPK